MNPTKLDIFLVDEEQVVNDWIERELDSFVVDFDEDDNMYKEGKKKRCRTSKVDLHNTLWMKLYYNPVTYDVTSREGKNFRQRFRLPLPLVKDVLVPLIIAKNIFETERKSYIPIEMKVLLCLRILARGNFYDDISEMVGIGLSTVAYIFVRFCNNFSTYYFEEFVHPPVGEDLAKVLNIYEVLGLPGAVGSMDCTHVWWDKCPVELTNSCKGNYYTKLYYCFITYY
jgi:hypothetical protein